jgi:heme-degrading monooxygenase HmoA
MYIAMNRFKVVLGSEAAFEQLWASRDTHLKEVPGFVEFHLLRGKTTSCMPAIRSGRTTRPLKAGQNRRRSVPLIEMLALATGRFILGIRSSKASKRFRPSNSRMFRRCV